MVIKFIPPKHLQVLSSDRGYIVLNGISYICTYMNSIHETRRFCVYSLDEAIAYMEGLGYIREN